MGGPDQPALRAATRGQRKCVSNWLLRLAFVVFTAGLVLWFIVTDPAPSIDARPAPTSRQAAAARDTVQQLRQNKDPLTGTSSVTLSPAHLDGLSALASHAFRPHRLNLSIYDGRFYMSVSYGLPFGRWLNAVMAVQGDGAGFPDARGRIGSLTLSPSATRLFMQTTPLWEYVLNINIPQPDELVRAIDVDDNALMLAVSLPDNVWQQFAPGTQNKIDARLAANYYCELALAQTSDPQTDFALVVRRAFRASRTGGITAESNGAAFVALAMLVVDREVGAIAGVDPSTVERCPSPPMPILLHGRADLPKHWTLSAVLAAGPGSQIAEAMGEWKELVDSRAPSSEFQQGDPTGFSLVDIAADRSGFRIATAAIDQEDSGLIAARLSQAKEDEILPPTLLRLEEGRNFNFIGRYGGLDDPRYAAVIAEIDAVLDGSDILNDAE